MSLKTDRIENSNVVTVAYDGDLGADDVSRARQELQDVASTHGRARLLLELGDVDPGRMEPKAVWEDVKGVTDLDALDRAALVTDAGWASTLVSLADKVTSFELRSFSASERDDAVAWLSS